MAAATGAVLFAVGGPAGAAASPPATTTPATTAPATIPPAKAMLLIDMNTGREIFGAHEHVRLPPASLTKMLTAMIAIDWLKPGTLIRVSPRAAGVAPDKVGMKAGQHWTLTIALHALLISSANDAAYALAERVAGSVERFAGIMGAAATELHMADKPIFRDPAGLDGTEGAGGGNLVSAWDLAIAARDLMADPTLASIVVLKSYRFTGPDGIVYELSSHNRAFLNSYVGSVGVKTGYTVPAGVCVAEEAVRGGRAMLAVVMNGVSPDQTAGMLLDKGFATPARAEGSRATLPPVVEPEPPVAARPHPITPAVNLPAAAPTTLAASHHTASVIRGPAGVGTVLAAAGALGVVAAVSVRRMARRRQRAPVGAHSRRRHEA